MNLPPEAGDDGYPVAEDAVLTVVAPGVLANDADPDSRGGVLQAVLVSGPSHGTVVLNPDGSFSYAPDANFNGLDYFTYKASDGPVESSPAKVTITVSAVNDPPVAVADSYGTDEDAALAGLPGVLANDTDVDGDTALTAVLVSGPSHGALALNADGAFTYTPVPDFSGADSFTYRAFDGVAYGNEVPVAITVREVNDAPTISEISDLTIDTNTGTGQIRFTIGDESPSTAILSGTSSNPTLVPAANIVFGGSGPTRNVTVTPAANQAGDVTITVTVRDSGGLEASETFRLTVKAVGYGFVNIKNLPPAAGVTFRPSSKGTLVDFEWKFTKNGVVVRSDDSLPSVEIWSPSGAMTTFTPANCVAAGIRFVYKSDAKLWDFHWVPKNAEVGTYYVVVKSEKTGQRFPAEGIGFPVVFKQ